MGEYVYEYAVSSAELLALVGQKVLAVSPILYNEAIITFETFQGTCYIYGEVKIGDKITQVYVEDIECNSLCVAVRLGETICRVHKLHTEKLEKERKKALINYADEELLQFYK